VIILDTNVLSELMKAVPAVSVVSWVADQPSAALFITSITQAEILHGIMLLPEGRRRNAIETAAKAMFEVDFAGRVLPFGGDAAAPYATIVVSRRRIGRPISQFDAQIAAIARSMGADLATRNTSDFEACGVTLINPWDSDC
jgi:predicted nucleic acid-binding protein